MLLKAVRPDKYDSIRENVRKYIEETETSLLCPSVLEGWEENPLLTDIVDRITISEAPAFIDVGQAFTTNLAIDQVYLRIHVYQCSNYDEQEEFTAGGDDGEHVLAATDRELPSQAWEGLWESLIYPDNIKLRLLDYIYSTIMLSEAGVNCRSLHLHALHSMHPD